ncbi:MAG TPA: DNA-binding response regulator, partial [Lachnospiraceae bacterium]|nr:DNA-binding response regulator [Lachnospiraceae bacterium]
DDYITKPFGMMELVSRIKAVLRRIAPKEKKILTAGDVVMDIGQHKVMVSGEEITLTLKEFELLGKLLENRNIVLTRDQL